MTVNAAHARGHRRDSLHSATGDSEPITDSGQPTCPEDVCPNAMDECPTIRCTLRLGHHGLCWNVRRSPYRAVYWSREAGT
jgi:hypothetical protein